MYVVCLYALFSRVEIIFYIFGKLSIHQRIKGHHGKSKNRIFDLGGDLKFQLMGQLQEGGLTMLNRDKE